MAINTLCFEIHFVWYTYQTYCFCLLIVIFSTDRVGFDLVILSLFCIDHILVSFTPFPATFWLNKIFFKIPFYLCCWVIRYSFSFLLFCCGCFNKTTKNPHISLFGSHFSFPSFLCVCLIYLWTFFATSI